MRRALPSAISTSNSRARRARATMPGCGSTPSSVSPSVDRQSTPPGQRLAGLPAARGCLRRGAAGLSRACGSAAACSAISPSSTASASRRATRLRHPLHQPDRACGRRPSASCSRWRRCPSSPARRARSSATGPTASAPRRSRCGRTPTAARRRTIPRGRASRWPTAIRASTALFARRLDCRLCRGVAPAGLEQLVLSGFAGPFGVLAGSERAVAPGELRPLGHVVRRLAAMAGMQTTRRRGGRSVSRRAGRYLGGRRAQALFANLTAEPIAVDLSAVAGRGAEAAAFDASTHPSHGGGWQACRLVEDRLRPAGLRRRTHRLSRLAWQFSLRPRRRARASAPDA